MLSIGAMKGGQQTYYLELAREDYYLNGGEPPGLWHGRGAQELGLSGVVEGEALIRLFAGFHPHDDRSLIQQQKYQEREHRPGWDLTFSAPKSVSVLWSQADYDARQAIQNAHLKAVQAALDYLEGEVAITRRGRGGHERLGARLVIATFEHHTSRAQDPQLHTHALVLNVCTDERGGSGTVESRPLYQAKMTAGAVYRAELSAQLEQGLGLTSQRHANLFEIEGVPKALITEFSKRRAAIEKVLAEKGYSTAAAASMAALSTRENKGHIAQEELLARWQEIGAQHGWSREEAKELLAAAQAPVRNEAAEMKEALRIAGERATQGQSTFSGREFTCYLAEECQGRGLGAEQLRAAKESYLAQSAEIVRLGRQGSQGKEGREMLYTTRDMMDEEKALLQGVDRSKNVMQPGVSSPTVEGVIATRQSFAEEQATALRHVTQEGSRIRVVSGMAGTGKTTFLHAARMAWELDGFEIHGAALNGQAAKGLEQGTGITSGTLHSMLWNLENGRLKLHEKSVLVIDEAAMVGTRQMRRVVEATERAGARLVIVGDARQLQPIEAGGPFLEIEKRVGSVELVEIKRQREAWARDAVKNFADGKAGQGLKAYAERGLVSIAEDRRGAMEALVGAWKENGVYHPQEQLILAGTRLEAAILNRMAQDERRGAGLLSEGQVAIPDTNETLAGGDRILFTRNSGLYGVKNGDRGDVIEVDAEKGTLAARLDSGELVRLSLADYGHVRPGYAMTTHKGQGATTENAYILAGGSMQDREISYVQASRSRGETRIFTDVEEAGESLTRLVRQMSNSRQKEMAHAFLPAGAEVQAGGAATAGAAGVSQNPTTQNPLAAFIAERDGISQEREVATATPIKRSIAKIVSANSPTVTQTPTTPEGPTPEGPTEQQPTPSVPDPSQRQTQTHKVRF